MGRQQHEIGTPSHQFHEHNTLLYGQSQAIKELGSIKELNGAVKDTRGYADARQHHDLFCEANVGLADSTSLIDYLHLFDRHYFPEFSQSDYVQESHYDYWRYTTDEYEKCTEEFEAGGFIK